MFRRLFLLLFLFPVFPAPAQYVLQRAESLPCRAQPSLVGKCFKVHGRLSLYNGAPTVRLWRSGTRRMLGVSASYSREGYRRIPADLETLLDWDSEVWGDYLVCPFTHRRRGEMQMICIEEGANIRVRKRQ